MRDLKKEKEKEEEDKELFQALSAVSPKREKKG